MAEYIKREALVDLILGKLKFMGDARIINEGDEKVLSEIDGYEKAIYAVHKLLLDKDLIENIQPVKRGEWLQHGKPDDYLWCCSACKEWIIYAEHDLYKHHFCGNCGADMREPEPIKG